MRDWDQAITDLNRAIGLDPKLAFAYNNRGWAYYEKNLYDSALPDLNKALELDPKMTEAFMNRGLLFILTGKKDLAIADFKKVLELTKDPEVVLNATKNIEIASDSSGYILER